MSKVIGLAWVFMILFPALKPQGEKFSKYKAIEAYEIRPGILMMPRYSNDRQVCEVELEKRHYSNETAFLDSQLPHEVIIQIIDELVPDGERGRQTMNFGGEYMSAYSGNGVTMFAEYENISIDIYREASQPGDVVAVVRWKNRKCS